MTVVAPSADRLRDDPAGGAGVGWVGDAPTDEELWGLAPDPDTDPPDGAARAGIPDDLTLAWLDARAAADRGTARWFEPGGLSRPGGRAGKAFAAGGPADGLEPGVVLAGLTARAWGQQGRASDDELVGITRAFGRLAAWAAAGQLAGVAELAARRDAQVAAGADAHLAEHVADEVAAALMLTPRAADNLVNFAAALAGLPATRAALWRGEIDLARAHVIADAVTGLDRSHAAAVEAAVIGNAGRQTTGQLRAAAHRAVLAADPAAAGRRRAEAVKDARVETWNEPAGTAALAGRDLPPAEVLAADRRIDALARQLKTAGAPHGMDILRARVYTALLLGIPIQTLHTQLTPADSGNGPGPTAAPCAHLGDGSGPTAAPCAHLGDGNGPTAAPCAHLGDGSPGTGPGTGPAAPDEPAAAQAAGDQAGLPADGGAGTGGAGTGVLQGRDAAGGQAAWQPPAADLGQPPVPPLPLPPLTGSLNLTMPLSTWLGGTSPGEVPGFGAVPAGDAQALAQLLAATPGTRICLTLTGPGGSAVAHGCAKASARPAGGIPELTVTITPLAPGSCGHQHETSGHQHETPGHRHETPGYRPSGRLAHLVIIRQRTCSFPGCRRPAARCDLDHTVPYDQGGRTCGCNLAPLCRRHHRAKQAQGWHLDQPGPGHLIWTLPHGRTYHTGPGPYPAHGP